MGSPSADGLGRFVLRDETSVQLGVDEGVVIDGLLPDEARLLARLGASVTAADVTTLAALSGMAPERAARVSTLLRERDIRCDRPPAAASLAGTRVVVDGRGPVPDTVVALLRGTDLGQVDGGAYAADAAELTAPDPDHRQPALVVLASAGPLPPGAGATWQAGGIPHLPLTCRDGAATLGPLVVPGRSSCLRCHDLMRTDLDPAWPGVSSRLHAGVLARPEPVDAGPRLGPLVTALAALLVTGWLDGTAPMAGVSVEVALPWPTVVHRYWPAHPDCGCGAVAAPTAQVEPSGGTVHLHDTMAW